MSRPVRIVVDGTTNLDRATRSRLGIGVIPIHVTNLPAELEAGLARGDYERFYEYLNRPHHPGTQPGTQAGSVWEARQVLEGLISRFDCDIVCLVTGGELSAVFDNTTRAAQELASRYPNRIVVLAEQAFLTISLLGQAAAEYAATGRGLNEVLAFIEDKRGRGFVTGTVVDIGRLRRSGRVPVAPIVTAVVGPVLRMFGLVPSFLLEQGRPRLLALVRKRSLERQVLNTIRERVGFLEPMVGRVAYTGSAVRAAAERLQSAIMRHEGFVLAGPVALEQASPVVGVHAGSALVAFGALGLGYESISTPVLLRFLAEAQTELKRFRRIVNAINVFPVRDGDTGSNLLTPLKDVGQGIAPELPFNEAIAEVAARVAHRGGGYSGGALAAYLLGFSSYVQTHETRSELQLETLVGALAAGTDRTYDYFGADAQEGTILSVMRACDQAAVRALRHRAALRNVLVSAYRAATDELLNPRVQEVAILRQERLADAGGFGFTLLLWALLRTLGLTRDALLQERYHQVLHEVRRHAELGQRLIYRRQPPELRGFCVEGCVRGEVADALRRQFLELDNRLPNPKMTFNVVNGTTHFHIHVSEGLEEEVRRIAGRFGYAFEPGPPTRLAKRRREIYRFRFVNFFARARRIPGYIAFFFGNWVAYAVLFPVMWYRAYRRLKALEAEVERLRLTRLGLVALANESGESLLVVDVDGRVAFAGSSAEKAALEEFLPAAIAVAVRTRLQEVGPGSSAPLVFQVEEWRFTARPLSQEQHLCGFLISYTQEARQ